MTRNQERSSADGYCIQVLIINGEVQNHLSQKSFYIENIGKGGFRFLSDMAFELEDRVQVLLRFPDDHSQEVLGRICYSESLDDDTTAYGFSVLDGFYSLLKSSS
jgi:PilZ domain